MAVFLLFPYWAADPRAAIPMMKSRLCIKAISLPSGDQGSGSSVPSPILKLRCYGAGSARFSVLSRGITKPYGSANPEV